ncbi:WD repeat-containing protein 35 [Chytridiales sp. JEL 0842]|nr:WD repeat-containing protein 35 [Chytridiales sp. JEL 0842]
MWNSSRWETVVVETDGNFDVTLNWIKYKLIGRHVSEYENVVLETLSRKPVPCTLKCFGDVRSTLLTLPKGSTTTRAIDASTQVIVGTKPLIARPLTYQNNMPLSVFGSPALRLDELMTLASSDQSSMPRYSTLPNNVLILGASGTGKSTMIDILARKHGLKIFEESVPMKPPNATQLAAILQAMLGNMTVSEDVDILSTVVECSSFVFSDMVAVGDLTMERALKRHQTDTGLLLEVSEDDIYSSIESVRRSKGIRKVGVGHVDWSNVAGLHKPKLFLEETLLLADRMGGIASLMSIDPPKGVLLYGPPGTGKTLIAKAVASTAKRNFFFVPITQLVIGEIGESEKSIARIFQNAIETQPSIIFIDEIEAIFASKSTAGDFGKKTLAQLLKEIDCLDKHRGVMILAASNHPSLIDPSLLRPGRIDRLLPIPLPSYQERLEILESLAGSKGVESGIDWTQIASRTDGWTGAVFAELFRKAASYHYYKYDGQSLDKGGARTLGWIACGGEDGLLKVLKLEGGGTTEHKKPGDAAAAGASASSNLSMNQTLEGHSGSVILSRWNEQFRKLTTSDQHGVIIVWILYKGVWYEEMINNRNKSVVTDMVWSKDGQRICIVYEDGAVIVGSVDGNRLWGKDLKNTHLAHVQWSPDSKLLLFGTGSGDLQVYDSTGTFLSKMPSFASESTGSVKIAAMDWYNGSNGYMEFRVPCLAVGFENGKVQIMKDEKDLAPLILDTNLRYLKLKWNNNGSILAISGAQYARGPQGDEKEVSVVQFYDPFGQLLRCLKVPGKKITSISWEHNGLRLALTVDSFIYFANIRPDYKWTFFAEDVIAYGFQRNDKSETTLIFWNTKTNEKYIKLISKLCFLKGHGDHCLLIAKADDTGFQYSMTVSNAIGTALETRYIEFAPSTAIITKNYVIAASSDIVVFWQFKVPQKKSGAYDTLRKKDNRLERYMHIDDFLDTSCAMASSSAELKKRRPTHDPIVSMAATDSFLLIARQSGTVFQVNISSGILEAKFTIPNVRLHMIYLNSNGTRVAILDLSGILKLYELPKRNPDALVGDGNGKNANVNTEGGVLLDFERKDVWDVKWSSDNPELLAIMEKTRMYIFRNVDPEEPIACNGYLCSFENLQIKAAMLDDIFSEPETPSKDYMMNFDSKSLRDTRNILSQVGLADGLQFVEDNPHPRLWRLVADSALEKLDFVVAQKAFVRCLDYKGIQFVKGLQKLNDPQKQKAEVLSYFNQYDAAEKLFLEIDRKDLAIDLRIRLGDWFRVVQLIKSGGSAADDILLQKAWNSIGEHYYDRQKWTQAITYYAQGRNTEKLIECYYMAEDYESLEKIMYTLSENSPMLKNIASKFKTVGLCDQAVSAQIKIGDIKEAIDTCVHLNKWNTAIELAEMHKFKEIEPLLAKYATYLLDKNKRMSAVELYRKANYCEKSAKLLFDLANEAAKEGKTPLRTKKLFVLAALEVERYHEISKSQRSVGVDKEISALEGLLLEDRKSNMDTKFLDNAWRGAEAYHFYLLAQRQFYSGNYDSAMRTALHLRNYDDVIEPKIIYSLLALISFNNTYFGVCSRAFIKLEGLPMTEDEQSALENLAYNIFTKFPPADPSFRDATCTNCAHSIPHSSTYCSNCQFTFPTCIVSGRPIYESVHFMCHVCKHRAIESEIAGVSCCPLCHTTL